jgi:integrase
MATIEPYDIKTGKRYLVRYRTPERKQTTKRGFKTKRDAEQWLNKIEADKATGLFIHPSAGKATISELGPEWLDRKKHLKPSSWKPLEVTWRTQVEEVWGSTRISDVRFTKVQQWITELSETRSATTVIRAHQILAGILDDAVKDRLLLTNPARGVDLPRKTKKSKVYLTHEQVHRLAAESKFPEIVLILSYCGLRWGELAGLRWRNVNHLRRRLNIEENAVNVSGKIYVGTPKAHEVRTVPVPRFLAKRLEAISRGKHPDDLLFTDADGKHMKAPQVDKQYRSWLAGALKRCNMKLMTPHDFRHTAASLAVQAGANVKAVQRMLGHKSAAMTLDVYADLFDSDLDDVADAMDQAVSAMNVLKMCSKKDSDSKENPLQPRDHAAEGAS